jgi:O-antigen/teichoic acid export membrane protein
VISGRPRATAVRSIDPEALDLEGRILRNTGWVAIGLGGRQIASLLSTLILARLLDPEDFGLVALALTVLYFVEQVQETGVGSALIHRREDVEAAKASALIYSPLAGLVFYGFVFTGAPLLARFLHAPDLTSVLRVMALVLVFRGLGVVPGAILERNLDFRSRTFAEVVAIFPQIGLFLGLAFAGFGVWSLVFGHLAAVATQTALYWVLVPWRPSLRGASRRVLLELMRYGRFVGGATVVTVVSNAIVNVVIGRVLGTASVGLYSVAFRLADFPSSVIGFILGRTMFSVYSMLQHDLAAFRYAYVRNLQRIALLALPLSLGLAIAAEPIVRALLGDKWLPAVPALRILAVCAMMTPFGGVSAEALKGLGKPQWNLVFAVLFITVMIPALVLLTPRFGLEGAAIALVIAIGATVVPAVTVAARSVKLTARDFAQRLAPSVACSALLAATLSALLPESRSMSPAASLAFLVSVGVVVYAAATALFARSVVVPMWLSLRGGGER